MLVYKEQPAAGAIVHLHTLHSWLVCPHAPHAFQHALTDRSHFPVRFCKFFPSVQRTSGKRQGRCAKVVARSTPLAEHASLIIVCVLGPNRKLVVQIREACCMQ